MNLNSSVMVRNLGLCEYRHVVESMRSWTRRRTPSTVDEIWTLQHLPVYTRGISCREKPRQMKKRIALIDSDRGGQITYHGPGQLVFYPLLDLRRLGLGVRDFVTLIEETVIDFLCQHEILGNVKEGAPGVYVFGAKVAAIGIRVQKGCTYHGFSVNVDMDLTPFGSIDPCGYADLRITQLKDVGISGGIDQVWRQLIERLTKRLCYKDVRYSAIRNANLGNPSIHL